MRIPTPSPPIVTPRGNALSDSEKVEALAGNLETRFQPVNDPSTPGVIEMVEVALKSYFMTPASQSLKRLRKPSVVSSSARLRARTVF